MDVVCDRYWRNSKQQHNGVIDSSRAYIAQNRRNLPTASYCDLYIAADITGAVLLRNNVRTSECLVARKQALCSQRCFPIADIVLFPRSFIMLCHLTRSSVPFLLSRWLAKQVQWRPFRSHWTKNNASVVKMQILYFLDVPQKTRLYLVLRIRLAVYRKLFRREILDRGEEISRSNLFSCTLWIQVQEKSGHIHMGHLIISARQYKMNTYWSQHRSTYCYRKYLKTAICPRFKRCFYSYGFLFR